jgi:hypothetical protein
MLKTALIMFLLVGSCATARNPSASRTVASSSGQVTTSDRMAVQRANDPHLQAEEEERRWGQQQAKQRQEELRLQREQEDKEKALRKGVDVQRRKDDGRAAPVWKP